MLALLFSSLALILALAGCGAAWLTYRATLSARSGTPGELMVRMAELEGEWQATLDGNARFLKRLAQREKRSAEKVAQEALEPTNGAGVGDKAQLRALARQRGILK